MSSLPRKKIHIITQEPAPLIDIINSLESLSITCFPSWERTSSSVSLYVISEKLLQETHAVKLVEYCRKQMRPVFLLTNKEASQAEALCKKHQCTDYLLENASQAVIAAKVKTHINISEMIRGFDKGLPDGSHSEESELNAVQDAAILCLAAVARVRDHSTGNHILRTQHYVKALAEYLRFHPDYKAELDDEDTIELFYKTASLHDIGKVGIPDAILQKPGRLTGEEYEIMKRHTVFGYQAIHSAELLLNRQMKGKAAKFLKIAQQVTLSHHERWDGNGYPQGLAGKDIPIVARLMSVADVYDAMISRRPYKDPIEHLTATDVLIKGRGILFDPIVIDAFSELQHTFDQISYILEDYFPSEADLTFHSPDEFF